MTDEFSWLPEDAPTTQLFNPSKAGIDTPGTPCCMEVQFSIFFDGTRNHRDEDKQTASDSNVARLFDTCKSRPMEGQFRLYVQGVGTPFPEVNEAEPHELGAREGAYGDRRLRYAYLFMVNRLAYLLTTNVVVPETIPDLSRAIEDEAQVRVWRRKLEHMLASPHSSAPKIPMITLDLFGFSRGATAARAFLNHLLEWAGDRQPKFCGIPLRVRFMGLFDTVASVEFADSVPLPFDGHMAWALPEHMFIPTFVEQCVHMVAGHEARGSFPLTSIAATREEAPGRLEIVYPGMHADVGGGYGPVSQGKGTCLADRSIRQRQGDQLSQIALNDMYDRACAAAVPLVGRDTFRVRRLDEAFAISPELQRSYDAHQVTLRQYRGGAPLMRILHTHYLAYLGWRRQVLPRATFIAQPFMTHCKQTQVQDHVNLDQSNAELAVHIVPFSQPLSRIRAKLGSVTILPNYFTQQHECMQMYDRYWSAAPAPDHAVQDLLMQYVHDSRAGFVLTDPQCERDYKNMHKLLERKDAEYVSARRNYTENVVPAHKRKMEANPTLDEEFPPPPIDPLNTNDRKALAIYRNGGTPIFTDAQPASSMDGKLDALDGIARSSRREVRWSYLRRRQVFRPVFKARDNARGEVLSRGEAKRLKHEDGLS